MAAQDESNLALNHLVEDQQQRFEMGDPNKSKRFGTDKGLEYKQKEDYEDQKLIGSKKQNDDFHVED